MFPATVLILRTTLLCLEYLTSPLSALLFTLYVNPIFSLKIHSLLIGYADDFKLINNCKSTLESDFILVTHWLNANNLKTNIKKTAYMVFSIHHLDTVSSIKLSGLIIHSVMFHKDLGIYLDPSLSFKYHIQHLINITRSKMYLTKRFFMEYFRRTCFAIMVLCHVFINYHIRYLNLFISFFNHSR